MVEGRCTLPRDCGVQLDQPVDGSRLIEFLRERGLNPKAANADATIHVRRGSVKNPTGFSGAYRLEVSAKEIVITIDETQPLLPFESLQHDLKPTRRRR